VVVAVTKADRKATRPGDTVTFFLYSHNIGTAVALDNTLENAIPAGTRYIDGSAGGSGCKILFTRAGTGLQTDGDVTGIIWKFKDPLNPGGEQNASLKVIIQQSFRDKKDFTINNWSRPCIQNNQII
jgi:uncharacterized repeat protein (TIGR01451 family)